MYNIFFSILYLLFIWGGFVLILIFLHTRCKRNILSYVYSYTLLLHISLHVWRIGITKFCYTQTMRHTYSSCFLYTQNTGDVLDCDLKHNTNSDTLFCIIISWVYIYFFGMHLCRKNIHTYIHPDRLQHQYIPAYKLYVSIHTKKKT